MARVGELLREERERKELTLRDIEEMTSIRIRYLEAIEEGNNSILPGEVYAKGFVRNYASALGFDGSDFVYMYKQELAQEGKTLELLAEETQAAAKCPAATENTNNVEQTLQAEIPQKTNLQPKVRLFPLMLILLVFAVAVGAGIYFFLNFYHPIADEAKGPDVIAAQSGQLNLPEESQAQGQAGEEQNNLPKEGFQLQNDGNGQLVLVPNPGTVLDSLNIELQASGTCWVGLYAGGREISSATLRRGDRRNWEVDEDVRLRIGNIDVVSLAINGERVEPIAETGSVADLAISILRE